jgi:co-chaperonin GroES (HSP10)
VLIFFTVSYQHLRHKRYPQGQASPNIERTAMLKATGTRVIVTRVEQEQATAGGIILQGGPKDIPQARIVDIGPRVEEKLTAGELVHLDWRGAAEITWNNGRYYVVDQSSLLARVSE